MRRFLLNLDSSDEEFFWPHRFEYLLEDYFFVLEENRSGRPWSCLSLFHNDKSVGHLYLSYNEENDFWVTHSWLEESYRGYGLGCLLYMATAQYGFLQDYQIVSWHSTSDKAKRVWRSSRLRYLFHIRYKDPRFFMISKRSRFHHRVYNMIFLDESVRELSF